jgi:hypothetical protein
MSKTSKKINLDMPLDTSLEAWIYNIRTVLHFPSAVLSVLGLLIIGTFVERSPRGSLKILNNMLGMAFLFIFPMCIAIFINFPIGILAASVALIVLARIRKDHGDDSEDSEGFSGDDSVQTTKLVSNPHRWFVEKVLGEMPVAISSDRIQTKRTEDNDNRTSSSSSMSIVNSSDGTK